MTLIDRIKNIENHINSEKDLVRAHRLLEMRAKLVEQAYFEDVPETYTKEQYSERLGAIWSCVTALEKKHPALSKELAKSYLRMFKQDFREKVIKG